MNDLATDEPKRFGKAMGALPGRHQRFVEKLLEYQGTDHRAPQRAATEAGFSPNHGHKLMRDERVLAAIREEATKRVAGAALTGVTVMLAIAQTNGHKDQFRAAKELAALNGFTAEQKIVVEHISSDSREKIQEIRVLAEQLGLDPRVLIERAGVVIDADFEVVEMATVDDSDW